MFVDGTYKVIPPSTILMAHVLLFGCVFFLATLEKAPWRMLTAEALRRI